MTLRSPMPTVAHVLNHLHSIAPFLLAQHHAARRHLGITNLARGGAPYRSLWLSAWCGSAALYRFDHVIGRIHVPSGILAVVDELILTCAAVVGGIHLVRCTHGASQLVNCHAHQRLPTADSCGSFIVALQLFKPHLGFTSISRTWHGYAPGGPHIHLRTALARHLLNHRASTGIRTAIHLRRHGQRAAKQGREGECATNAHSVMLATVVTKPARSGPRRCWRSCVIERSP